MLQNKADYYTNLYKITSKCSASDDFMCMEIGTLQNTEEKAIANLKCLIGWYIDQANVNPAKCYLEFYSSENCGKFEKQFAKTNYNNLVYVKAKVRLISDSKLVINLKSIFDNK